MKIGVAIVWAAVLWAPTSASAQDAQTAGAPPANAYFPPPISVTSPSVEPAAPSPLPITASIHDAAQRSFLPQWAQTNAPSAMGSQTCGINAELGDLWDMALTADTAQPTIFTLTINGAYRFSSDGPQRTVLYYDRGFQALFGIASRNSISISLDSTNFAQFLHGFTAGRSMLIAEGANPSYPVNLTGTSSAITALGRCTEAKGFTRLPFPWHAARNATAITNQSPPLDAVAGGSAKANADVVDANASRGATSSTGPVETANVAPASTDPNLAETQASHSNGGAQTATSAPDADIQSPAGDEGGAAGILAITASIVAVGFWRRSRRRKRKPPENVSLSRASRKVPKIDLPVDRSSMASREQGPPEVLPPSSPTVNAKNSVPETPKASSQGSVKPASVPSVSFQIHPTSLTQQQKQPANGESSVLVTATAVTVPAAGRAGFRVSSTIVRPSGVSWYFPGATATVLGFKIADGMVYVGHGSPKVNGFDASFIDPSLPVASNSASAGPLGYWPSYAQISPDCRRRYLEWLSQGKHDPTADLGYVFIYFYGLERRLIVENPETDEALLLIAEIERLRAIYTGNGSFNAYSARLIEAGTLIYTSVGREAGAVSTEHLGNPSPILALMLASEIAAGRPLSFELAVTALCSLSDFWFAHKQVIQRSRSLFLQVFRSRFQSRFPRGFLAEPRSGSKLTIPYRGALAGLSVDLAARAGVHDLPDPMSSSWAELLSVGNAVAGLVASHLYQVSRYPGWQNSLAALVECPPELRTTVATDGRKWVDSLPILGEFNFGEVAKHAIGLENIKWTVKHRQEISAALAEVGFSMEPGPDEREHLEDSTSVQVFRHSGSAMSRNAEVVSAAAMMVAAIAKTAASAADRIESFWISQIPSRLSLTPDEMTLLRARLAWLRTRSISLTKMKRLLEDASSDERAFCAWSATVAVGATGTPEKSRIALLEAMHDTLGVPRARLYAALHAGIATASEAADGLVVISEAVAEPLHVIPQPPESAPSQDLPAPISYETAGEPSAPDELPAFEFQPVTLPSVPAIEPEYQNTPASRKPSGPIGVDLEKVAKVRAETARTAAILAEVFVDDDESQQGAQPSEDGPFPGLDAEYAAFLSQLLFRAEWPRDDYDHMASAGGLMPDGAMEAINEWAFEHLDNALLEDGDPVVVNRELLDADAGAAAAD
jgi:TerB N-terminal domain/TerB-C domain